MNIHTKKILATVDDTEYPFTIEILPDERGTIYRATPGETEAWLIKAIPGYIEFDERGNVQPAEVIEAEKGEAITAAVWRGIKEQVNFKKIVSVKCPSCGESSKNIGPIPFAFHFLSQKFNRPVNPGNLYQCHSCSLYFRYPCLSPQELIKLYKSEGDEVWVDDSNFLRKDTLEIVKEIENQKGTIHSILDVGCYTGTLLLNLKKLLKDNTFELFGVEPSLIAAGNAAQSGITMLGSTINDLERYPYTFDLIIMVDVFEHVQDTWALVKEAAEFLTPKGQIIIVTGALDSAFMKKKLNRAHYVSMPEHVAFITEKHAKWLAAKCNLTLKTYRLIRHGSARNLKQKIRDSIRGRVSSFMNSSFIRPRVAARTLGKTLKSMSSAGMSDFNDRPDHAVVVFQNKQ